MWHMFTHLCDLAQVRERRHRVEAVLHGSACALRWTGAPRRTSTTRRRTGSTSRTASRRMTARPRKPRVIPVVTVSAVQTAEIPASI